MKRAAGALHTALIALGLSLFLAFSGASADQDKRVLVLNSYHQGYKWTDDEIMGAIAGLGGRRDSIRIYIEYMGTKWAFDKQYFEQLRATYRQKFRTIPFDVIIATDNDAFNFLKMYRDDVFGRVPVVFCGVNWFTQEDLAGHEYFTGVNEDADIAKTVEVMLKLHPKTSHIHVVIDSTTTGRRVHEKMAEVARQYRNRVTLRMLENMEMPDILAKLAKLPDDSAVLITVFQQDKTGTFFEFSESTRLIAQGSRVPVYGLWDFNLGHGIVGGMLTSGFAQGESAGRIALRILRGESPDAIPVVMESPNRYMFDYLQMKRFGIRLSDLPGESIVINEPPSFYSVNKGLVWGLVFGVALLSGVVVILLTNIYRRTRAEEALRKSEGRYHTLVDNLTVGVYRNTPGPEGRFIQVNPAMVKIFGYDSAGEMMAFPVTALYQNAEERASYIEEIALTGSVRDKELALKKKDGTPIWVSVNARAQRNTAGEIVWIDGVLEEITERKKLEEQLRQAQKMEAIGTLAGGIAHDFNNILTAIIGYGNLLKLKLTDEDPLMHYVSPILSSAERAAQLTQSLLAFSRKQIIRLQPVNLNDIVKGMEQMLLRVIGEDIELETGLRAERLMIMADKGQIEQVLLNLITNARDAMPDGGMLSITTDRIMLERELLIKHEYISPGEYAVLAVSDIGRGMNAAIRQRIFEPFFSTKAMGKGTGLGLSIVYGIVKQHNGDISVYSEPGKGTTFKVYLPLIEYVGGQEEHPAGTSVVGGHETVLVGEDNDEVRMLACEILEHGGYTVIMARDGEDALARFREHRGAVDLLLLDVVMPKKNGKEVYDEVKRLKPSVKVLFMSGYTANIIHRKGVLEEGINFISKPLSPEKLLRKVREVLAS